MHTGIDSRRESPHRVRAAVRQMSVEMLKILLPAFCTFVLLLSISNSDGCLASNLKDRSNRADYVLIAPSSYFQSAARLAHFHEQKDLFTTMVVDIDSIIQQFGPHSARDTALKSFIQFALINWSDPKPKYFVFVGNVNAVPSHPEPETITGTEVTSVDSLLMIDQWFVEVDSSNGSIHMNGCVGRLPAWDSLGLRIMVDKTINYETDTSGSWCAKAISLCDYDQVDGCLFESDSKYLQSFIDSLWTDTISVHMRCDSPSRLDSCEFVHLWSQGAGLVMYCGHAKATQFSATAYFSTASVDSLSNGADLPVCFLGGCDLTYDTGPTESIPTHLLDLEGGGAVAAISSEGLMFESETVLFWKSILQALIRNHDMPLGLAYENAMPGWIGGICERFTFLGDPAIVAKHSQLPAAVIPPRNIARTFSIEQNYPNPFNPTTVISYQLTVYSHVTLKVYDVLGRLVAILVDENQNPGGHIVTFNGDRLPSGIYFYKIVAGRCSSVRKMMILK